MKPAVSQILPKAIEAHKVGEFERADKLYRLILQKEPRHPHANHNLGVLLVSLDQTTEALFFFKNAIRSNPSVTQFWISYLDTLERERSSEEVGAAISGARELGLKEEKIKILEARYVTKKREGGRRSDPSRQDVDRLLRLYQSGELERAERLAEVLTSRYPDHQISWKILGAVQVSRKKKSLANIAFTKAVEICPEDYEAHNNLSLTQRALGDLKSAEISSRRAIALNPNYSEAHNNLGVTLKEMGDFGNAESSFRKAIELMYENARAHNNLGNTLRELGRSDEAYASYTRTIELAPEFEEALINRWQLLFEKGDFSEALQDINRCKSGRASACRLETLNALGKFEEIYESIEMLARADKKNIRVAAFSSFLYHHEKKENPYNFCNSPLSFIYRSSLDPCSETLERFAGDLISELACIPEVWEPPNRSTRNGFQTPSYLNIFSLQYENLCRLKSLIKREIARYRARYLNDSAIYIKEWPDKSELHGWCVKLRRQGFQSRHIHPSGWISGVVYLKVIPSVNGEEGAIEFSLNGTNYEASDSPSRLYRPALGDIFLFPSSLHHRTIPFHADVDRISIAFDLKPVMTT